MPALREYEDEGGRSPFGRWFGSLATPAALKVRTALARLEAGNTSALKGAGKGVAEVVILLGGSTKAGRQEAVADAQARWADYKARKRRG